MQGELEGQASLHLQDPSRHSRSHKRTVRTGRRHYGRGDLTELSAGDVARWVREVGMIENVVGGCADSETHALGDRDVLQDAEVRVEITRPPEEVAWNVAERGFAV